MRTPGNNLLLIHLRLIGSFFVLCGIVHAQHRIVLTIKKYPDFLQNIQQDVRTASSRRTAEDMVASARLAHSRGRGLIATYAGYTSITNPLTGQLTFPRKQQQETIYLYITPSIEPIIMLGRTIHHWELIKNQPVAVYKFELNRDKKTDLAFWKTTKEETNNNRIIPLNSIVLFAHPNHIHVPTGITITEQSPHFVLPIIYSRKYINLLNPSLASLAVQHFFERVPQQLQKAPFTATTQIQE